MTVRSLFSSCYPIARGIKSVSTISILPVMMFVLSVALSIGHCRAAETLTVEEIKSQPCPEFPKQMSSITEHAQVASTSENPTYFLFDPDRQCHPDDLIAAMRESPEFVTQREKPAVNALPFWQRLSHRGLPHHWYSTDKQSITLGFIPHDTWFLKAFEIPSETQRATLSVSNPLIDYLDAWIYQADGSLLQTYSLGDQLPFEQRPVLDTNFALPVNLSSNGQRVDKIWVLFRVRTNDSLHLTIRMHLDDEYLMASNQYKLHQGLYIGIILAMLIYNIVLTARLPEKEYSIYAVWVPCIAMVVITNNGFAFQYIWPSYGEWNNYASQVFGSFSTMFAGFFCLTTLRVFRNVTFPLPQILFVFSIVAGVFAVICMFRWLPAGLAMQIANMITSTIIGCIITASFICVTKGVLLSKSYFMAWSTISVGGTLTIMELMGVVSNTLTQHSLQIGSTLEVLLMSILLSARVHEERQQTIILQKNINQELETKVAERTKELDEANQKLSILSVTDGLTGLSNRRHFDELFAQMFHVAQRVQGAIHVLMVDLDYFKKINDTYGHAFGDTCLKHAAHIIKSHCKRTSDVVARYGGEEFSVLLSHTQDGEAERIANDIRLSLMQSPLSYQDQTVQLTCSIGISANTVSDTKEIQLLERADEMLYLAKRCGRNCVKLYGEQNEIAENNQKNIAV